MMLAGNCIETVRMISDRKDNISVIRILRMRKP